MTKILIVDDEEMMRMVTKKILSAQYEVLTASSGAEAMSVYEKEKPSLILSDLLMPEMSGFELHEALKDRYNVNVPIMYMTADDDAELEGKGFDTGAMDFIRKPFRADVLLRRIENILSNITQIKDLTEEATIDKLTGFLNKASATKTLTEVCRDDVGVLLMIDLDSFKLVNDIHGHEAGDEILRRFAEVIRHNTRSDDVVGRFGGDEFVAFCRNVTDENMVAGISMRINSQLVSAAKEMFGEDMSIPLGVSIGGVYVPEEGTDFAELFAKADKALYYVKQNGKHGYSVFGSKIGKETIEVRSSEEDLKQLTMIMEERNTANCAFWLGQDAFSFVYRYMIRYIQSYHGFAYKVLFTINPVSSDHDPAAFASVTQQFGERLNMSLRKSDIMMQTKPNQFFLILAEIDDKYIRGVIDRALDQWKEIDDSNIADLNYAMELITADDKDIHEFNRSND
ncbi:MAG: diguanylate cyclase [Clostridiales bacterium]|nr:diguanylate cyclase [Clostridiales bacterium]